MSTDRKVIMPVQTPELVKFEKEWNDAEKILLRGTVTREAFDFLEEQAFRDFGMMKKGAVGMELTKLILIAKETLESQ